MASVGSMMILVRARPVRDALTPPQHAEELCPSPAQIGAQMSLMSKVA